MRNQYNPLEKSTELTTKERIGIVLAGASSLPVLPYLYNRLSPLYDKMSSTSRETEEILVPLAESAGNVPAVFAAYGAGKLLGRIFKNEKITNAVLGLSTLYLTLGEIFGSKIAPDLFQIMPGTPHPKDIPLVVLASLGLYLANRTNDSKTTQSS